MTTPTGIITAWDGLLSGVPSDWKVCDGTSGTPDLRNLFVLGASADVDITSGSSGALTHNHMCSSLSDNSGHSHSKTGTSGASSGTVSVNGSLTSVKILGSHTHPYTLSTPSGGNAHGHSVADSEVYSSLPPYYKLFYIMKT